MTGLAPTTLPAIDRAAPIVSSADSRKAVFETLHGVRGVAALAVVAWHEASLPWSSFHPGSGYLAVDLFFVLSGLVLAHAYDGRFAAGLRPGRFMVWRLIRMYPLYMVGLLLASVALVASFMLHLATNWVPAEFALAFGCALLFAPTPPMHTNAIFPLNNPAWSLFFELVANAVFAVFWRRLSTRTLLSVAALSGAILLACDVWFGSMDLGSDWPTFLAGFPRVTYSFFAGVLISRLLRQASPKFRFSPWLVLLAVAVLLSAAPQTWRASYDAACVLLVLPFVVWIGALVEPAGASRAIFVGLGAASYAVYAIHAPLLAMIGKRLGTEPPVPATLFSLGFILLVVGLGLLLDRLDRIVRVRLTALSAGLFAH